MYEPPPKKKKKKKYENIKQISKTKTQKEREEKKRITRSTINASMILYMHIISIYT